MRIIKLNPINKLQQSDSESDAGIASSGRNWTNQTSGSRMSGLMRPTISSQNKINHQTKPNSSSSNNLPMVLRRRGMQGAYSSGMLMKIYFYYFYYHKVNFIILFF